MPADTQERDPLADTGNRLFHAVEKMKEAGAPPSCGEASKIHHEALILIGEAVYKNYKQTQEVIVPLIKGKKVAMVILGIMLTAGVTGACKMAWDVLVWFAKSKG